MGPILFNVFLSFSFFGEEKNEMLLDLGGGGLTSVLDVQSFFLLLKKNGFGFAPID